MYLLFNPIQLNYFSIKLRESLERTKFCGGRIFKSKNYEFEWFIISIYDEFLRILNGKG